MYFTWCAPSHECYILCIAHHHHHITILCISHHHHTIVSRDICMAHHHHITIHPAHLRLAGTVLKISLGAFGAHQRQFSAARAQLTASLTPVVRAQRHGAFFGALSGVLIRGVGCAAQRHTLFLDTCVVPQLSTESEGKKGGKRKGKQRKNMCGIWRKAKEKYVGLLCDASGVTHRCWELVRLWSGGGKKRGGKKRKG